jgi:Tfp pilus assembly protein PilF
MLAATYNVADNGKASIAPLAATESLLDQAGPLIALAAARLDQGDARAALFTASEALHRAAHLPQAHYVYGQAWTALGNHGHAERAFAAALQLAPAWADAWVNYGIARYRQGAIEDAKTAMRQALRAAPGHAAATANLGAFLRISGDSETAEKLLAATVAREPQNAAARLNLVADLLQAERAAEALALLEAAEPPAGDALALRHWLLQKSLALLQLARPAEARTVLDALAALGPLPRALAPIWYWRQVLLALAEGDGARAQAAAAKMEAVLEEVGAEAVPEHRIMAHYDLAKFWSGLEARQRAFAHWQAGHALLKLSQPFSRDAHRAFVDANIATFDRARFASGPRARNHDLAPVFIVGMPRSGTTLVEQTLDAHRDCHGAGERSALMHSFATLGGSIDGAAAAQRVGACDAATLDATASRYLDALRALAPGQSRIVDKMPGNFNYLGLAGLMLPGARIIHCARDPRDIGLSIFTFRFHGVHAYAHDLGDLGWYIGEHDRLMAHWKAVLPNSILTVNLSDWVEDFAGTLARVLGHLDLPHDPACERFYEHEGRVRTVSRAQVREPVNARGLGRWRPYANELAPMIAELDRAGAAPRDPRIED